MHDPLDDTRSPTPPASPGDIAVVGMACRFPGASTPEEFWRNIRDGVESVVDLSRSDLEAAGVEAALLRDPHYVRRAAVLDGVEYFDAGFFGFSPRDAAIMDPQHRHFLEVAWEALESAGHPPEGFDGSIGVYAGCGMTAYMMYHLVPNKQLMNSVGLFLVRHTGNDKDFLATRVSYSFDLRGPSVNIQTACSTSLVAIHVACQNLMNGECDMALAGGVTIELPQRVGYLYQEGEILSHDGHCRSFDAASTGTVFGSGAGVVVLRRLQDALDDGDTILAVIKGTAINNDGSSKVGYLAPSVDGQAKVIAEAQAIADVKPDEITYVETHGTGTQVGDPIEVTALTDAFRRGTERVGFCGLGSVKTNIGHLDTAAGVASFIKVVQALRHAQLPPSLHFTRPNALIDFASSPFYVNAQLRPWLVEAGSPRRAGVSSLGVGGTNAHCIVEEAPLQPSTAGPAHGWHILPLSARTDSALEGATDQLARSLTAQGVPALHDVAYTLQKGRRAFAQRRAVVARDASSAADALLTRDAARMVSGVASAQPPGVVFLFPGGGAQYAGMASELYEALPVYRAHLDECLEVLQRFVTRDLRVLMFPSEANRTQASRELERPSLALPALFATSYALGQLWMSWGLVPTAMAGHSMGEYVAACLSGVMSLEGAASLVCTRGRLFERVPAGGMLSVPMSETDLLAQLPAGVSIAAVNGPELCVASGPVALLDRLEHQLRDRQVESARLHIEIAAHSSMLEPILSDFRKAVQGIELRPPTIPFTSNVTGGWAEAAMVTDPEYWVMHLRQTVRFESNLDTLLRTPHLVLIEVGPGTTLTTLAKAHPCRGAGHATTASLRHPQDRSSDLQFIFTACGRAWAAGASVRWQSLHDGPRRRVPLPTYAFDHQRYWIERPSVAAPSQDIAGSTTLGRLADANQWYSQITWQRADRPTGALPPADDAGTWLVFLDESGIAQRVVDRLKQLNHSVVRVRTGRAYQQRSVDDYVVSPGRREDYDAMFQAMAADGKLPRRILHAWSLSAQQSRTVVLDALDSTLDRTFYSLLFLAQALSAHDLSAGVHMVIATNDVQQVIDEPVVHPVQATTMGAARVIPREFPSVTTVTVDLQLPHRRLGAGRSVLEAQAALLTAALLDELCGAPTEAVVAYRRRHRWVQVIERTRATAGRPPGASLRPEGVYLITGGLGAIGLTIAQHLASTVKARLVLVSRTGLPAREAWTQYLDTHDAVDAVARRIRLVQLIEEAGGRVVVVTADVANADHMRAAVRQAIDTFGALHGVIHAAGTIADGVIPFKTKDSAASVLAPKVRGTVVLDDALAGQVLDFFVVFSSTSALLGPAGQIDYTAANAFLNAFAYNRQGRAPGLTVAIDWGLWKDVGMAVDSARLLGYRAAGDVASPLEHPLLQNCKVTAVGDAVAQPVYSVAAQWALDEHRLGNGVALMPGTGYLEVARALGAHVLSPDAPLTIEDASFVAPLAIGETEQRHVRIRATKGHDGFNVSVGSYGQVDREASPAWVTHATWRVRATQPALPASIDLDAIRRRCNREVVPVPGEPQTRQAAHLRFGPRWQTLTHAWFGVREALAELTLPAGFEPDLEQFAFHPALVDLATGFALPLLDGYDGRDDFYIPLSYGKVNIYAPLPSSIVSYARCNNPDEREVGVFDYVLTDQHGTVLATIDEFVMRRVSPASILDAVVVANDTGVTPPIEAIDGNASTRGAAPIPELLEIGLEHGITPAEGVEAFTRVLALTDVPQVVVSSLDLHALARHIDASARTGDSEEVDSSRQARPSNASSYVGPRTDLERQIASIWQEVLGLDQVGIKDNFFDLGGHSLLAVRLFNKLKKIAGQNMPLSTLFEAPTVEQLAALLRQDAPTASWSCLVPIQPNGVRPPFFCIHGLGGNIVEFLHLARHLRGDQPFYGIQARGLDGKEPYFTRVEDFASHYIKQIRGLQPQGPYYLGGSSFGGLVAYEMARQLRQHGESVAFLALFDSYGKDYPKPLATRTVLERRLNNLRVRIDLHSGNLRNLPPSERWDYVKEKVGQLPGRYQRRIMKLADRVEERVRLLFLPKMLREQFALTGERAKDVGLIDIPRVIRDVQVGVMQAARAYRVQPYEGAVTLFRATSQPPGIYPDPTNGWGSLVLGDLRILDVPGHHGAIIREPRVKVLADLLNRCLLDAQERPSVPAQPPRDAGGPTSAPHTRPEHVGAS